MVFDVETKTHYGRGVFNKRIPKVQLQLSAACLWFSVQAEINLNDPNFFRATWPWIFLKLGLLFWY